MKIILIRHCETDWNAGEDRLQGHIDIELNKRGCEQAIILAEKLKVMGISIIFSSDLKRASETSKIISAHLNKVPIKLDGRLRECNFGSLQGKTKKEVQEIYKSTGCCKGPHDYNFAQFGGENRKKVLARQLALLDELKKYEDDVFLLVGHGTSLNTILSELGYDSNLLREEYRIIEYPTKTQQ